VTHLHKFDPTVLCELFRIPRSHRPLRNRRLIGGRLGEVFGKYGVRNRISRCRFTASARVRTWMPMAMYTNKLAVTKSRTTRTYGFVLDTEGTLTLGAYSGCPALRFCVATHKTF
jgi:hypothetical protein